MVFTEAGRNEPIDILIAETPAFFDHRFCQSRQRSELTILRQTALANGLDIRRIDPLLERQSRMERDRPSARVGHRVGEQNGLDLRFREAASVYMLEQTDEAVDQNWRGRHCSGDVRGHAESRLQLLQCRLRTFRSAEQWSRTVSLRTAMTAPTTASRSRLPGIVGVTTPPLHSHGPCAFGTVCLLAAWRC